MTRWRSVVGYEGVYEVSHAGDVRRVQRAHGATVGRHLKWHKGYGEYPRVTLTAGGRMRTFYVHALVAEAFIGSRPDGCEINHIDLDRWNPEAANLEYVTRAENIQHARDAGRYQPVRGEENASAKLTEADVLAIRASAETSRALGARYGVSHGVIQDIKHRRKWKHIQDENAAHRKEVASGG